VKSALFESSAFLVGQHMAGEAVVGQPAAPMPARGAAWGIYETYATASGGDVFIGVTSDKHWQRFCAAFDLADLAEDPALRDNTGRVAAKARLKERVAAAVAPLTAAEVCARCERAEIPFSPVATPSDLFEDPQLNAGIGMMDTQLGGGRHAKFPRLPIEIGSHALGLRRQPPVLGEHNDEIAAEIRGARAAADARR
jgi:crotonobetainyl-CoA:carnitine CoA-transferase CaiB-like acyl-CoA transferase